MDNLKFRAFHKKSGEIENVLLICFVNRYVDVLPEAELEGGNIVSWSFDEIELLQYAGKLGHTETPLWEGDIVHVHMNKHGKPIGNGHKAYIKYNHHFSQWQYCYLTVADFWGTSDIKGEFLTYLGGNIHQNKEILINK